MISPPPRPRRASSRSGSAARSCATLGPGYRVGRLLAVDAGGQRRRGASRSPTGRAALRGGSRAGSTPRRSSRTSPSAARVPPDPPRAPDGRRRWTAFEDHREASPFEVVEGLDAIAVDDDALDDGLVVVTRESVGTAADIPDRVPAGTAPDTPVRLRVEQSQRSTTRSRSACRACADGGASADGRPRPAAHRDHAGAATRRCASSPGRPAATAGRAVCLAAGLVARPSGSSLAYRRRRCDGRRVARRAIGRRGRWRRSAAAIGPRRVPGAVPAGGDPRSSGPGARPRRRSAAGDRAGGRARRRCRLGAHARLRPDLTGAHARQPEPRARGARERARAGTIGLLARTVRSVGSRRRLHSSS